VFEPLKVKRVGIDNDKDGLYLYLRYSSIWFIILSGFLFYIVGLIIFLGNFFAWFIIVLKNAWITLFFTLFGLLAELIISIIILFGLLILKEGYLYAFRMVKNAR
jgi:hypothetical protein